MTLDLAALLPPVSDADKLDLHFRLLAAVLRGQSPPSVSLDQLAAIVTQGFSNLTTELHTMSDQFDAEIARLQADIAAQGTVIASATTAFQGLAAQIAAAETQAKAAGATDAQIAAVAAVRQGIEQNTAGLAAAIPANTAAATTGGLTAGTAEGTSVSAG